MNKQLTRTLLIGCLLACTGNAHADPELNRCLATNTAPNRYEICYGQMRSRAYQEAKSARKARTDAILKQLEAEQAAAKEREAQGQTSRTTAPTPKPAPTPQPTVQTQPEPTVTPKVVPRDDTTKTILSNEPHRAPTIFDQPGTQRKQANQPAPAEADRGTQIIPSSDPASKSGSETKPSSPIKYY